MMIYMYIWYHGNLAKCWDRWGRGGSRGGTDHPGGADLLNLYSWTNQAITHAQCKWCNKTIWKSSLLIIIIIHYSHLCDNFMSLFTKNIKTWWPTQSTQHTRGVRWEGWVLNTVEYTTQLSCNLIGCIFYGRV